MSNVETCPNCDTLNTEFIEQFSRVDTIEHIRICNDCPTEYVVEFGNPIVTDTTYFEEYE